MKVFVTGASGMLASDVIPQLIQQKHQVIATDFKPRSEGVLPLDITEKDKVFQATQEYKPDYVFHFAAETNVDLCDQDPDHAFRVNTIGTESVALACQRYKVRMVYISTAGVFYGDKKEPYTEFDTPNPINIYGHSKLQGEVIVRNLLSEYFIFRPGWMVGGWEIDKKFVCKIVQQLKEGKRELRVVADKFGSPTFTKDFAKNIMNVVNTERFGLYHMTNQGSCSRHEVALKIVEYMGLKDKVKVHAISSSEFPLPAPRADSEMMRNYKLDLLGLNQMPHWQESLEDYIKTNKNK